MISQVLKQTVAVIRLEMKKTFLARRGLWVYLLAFAPVLLFTLHSIHAPRERARLARLAERHSVTPQALNAVSTGMTRDQVVERLGQPYRRWTRRQRRQDGSHFDLQFYKYTDGRTRATLRFSQDRLDWIGREDLDDLPKVQKIFATTFQFYFLRLAIFFGCVGIFINLFRGEMLDKSLHFYLLTPMRREILLLGKYLSGLLATLVIFTASTALQWWAMLWQFEGSTVAAFLANEGWANFWAYVGVAALACVGYGSIFLAIGLLFRNPVVPAAVVLLWESANPFLPPALKMVSMIYYLQSICPVSPLVDRGMPPMIALLIEPTEPATVATALTCIALLAGLVLAGSAWLSRRLEINYSTD